jgi:hypothetical protein
MLPPSAVDAGDVEELERAWLAALATGCPGDLIATGDEAGLIHANLKPANVLFVPGKSLKESLTCPQGRRYSR